MITKKLPRFSLFRHKKEVDATLTVKFNMTERALMNTSRLTKMVGAKDIFVMTVSAWHLLLWVAKNSTEDAHIAIISGNTVITSTPTMEFINKGAADAN